MKKLLYLLLLIPSLSFGQSWLRLPYYGLLHNYHGDTIKQYFTGDTAKWYTDKSAFSFNKPIFVNGVQLGSGGALDSSKLITKYGAYSTGINIGPGQTYKINGTPLYNVIGITTSGTSHNTAIGYGALVSRTTGVNNFAGGYNSLNAMTSGSSNSAGGSNSLLSLTTGSNNTGFGNNSLFYTTGDYNTGVGSSSLVNNTSGSNNVGIGYASGSRSVTLSNRLFINSIIRNNLQEDTTKSIIYGLQDDDVANQKLYLNANVYISQTLTISQYSGSLTDGIPTDSEINAIIGTAASKGAGFQATIKDSNGTSLLYKVESDGTYWYYTVMTKAQ